MSREKFIKLASTLYAIILVDPETGVEYVASPGGGAILPFYNADGSLKINEEYRPK
ncbi:hypothetical protein [Companilactobacillus mishanensis]|uniref:hypothetical protein n=1 Tax=Companilactobacillus mishanensis TaxID=2486008 RepID=UPI001296C1D7|nr:hypothetical protein [Companilactobacillus mishanensis]